MIMMTTIRMRAAIPTDIHSAIESKTDRKLHPLPDYEQNIRERSERGIKTEIREKRRWRERERTV